MKTLHEVLPAAAAQLARDIDAGAYTYDDFRRDFMTVVAVERGLTK